MDSIPQKHCSRCNQDKPLTDFGKHRGEPDGLQRWCKACRKANTDNDPVWKARKVEYDRLRRLEKGDQIRAQAREKYHTDPEHREKVRLQYERRKQTENYKRYERQRHYRRWADPEWRKYKIAYHRERRHKDPEYRRKVYHWRRARQARIVLQGKPFTHAEWVELCERYDHRCLCCGERKTLSPDHVVPVSKGGSSAIENIQPLCIGCNKRKSARTIDYRT